MLSDIHWNDIIEFDSIKDVNNAYAMFYNKYREIYDICFPVEKKILCGKNVQNNHGLLQHLLNPVTESPSYTEDIK